MFPGTRFESSRSDFGVEFSGERRECAAEEPVHRLGLEFGLRFCSPSCFARLVTLGCFQLRWNSCSLLKLLRKFYSFRSRSKLPFC